MTGLRQDLRFTFRSMRRDLGFTIVAVLILSLGIGANVAVFSVVNTILLRPLPFREAQKLVRIVEKNPQAGESSKTYSADATEDLQQKNHAYESVSGYFAFTGPDNLKLAGRTPQPTPLTGILVAEGFFQTLGVEPAMGRLFQREEFVKHAAPVALLAYPLWKGRFGGDRGIVGRTVNLNNTSVTVIGVLPETFDFGAVFSPGARADLFMPYIMDDFRDDGNDLALIARLKRGVSVAQAQREADQLIPQIYFSHKHPEYGKGYTGQVTELKEYVSGKLRRPLIALWGAVGLILLIVCVNLANLLLARTAARSKEFAMRTALGAGRGRLVRQSLTESLALAAAGALGGFLLSDAVITYLAQQGSLALPLLNMIRMDGTALGWTLVVALGAALLFGVMPGIWASFDGNLQEVLKDSGPGTSKGRKHDRIRSTLVVAEIALACVLLVGAGLLLRSFLHVLDVDLGFQASGASAIHVEDRSDSTAKRTALWQELVGRASAIPGVEAAGISDNLPMSRNRSWGIAVKGQQKQQAGDFIPIYVYIVAPGYLKAMGMHLRQGRDLTWDDLYNNRAVVILNETVARKLWPGRDPIGRAVTTNGVDSEVIGVIADVRESSAEENAGAQMYLPNNKNYGPEGTNLVLRSKLPASALAGPVMHMLRQMNPEQPATELKTIQTLVDRTTSPRRFFVLLAGTFAGLGILLASLGIYGVISYSVTRQTQEIGIKMALGATAGRVQSAVIARTLRLALMGMAVGIAASVGVARLIESMLFQTAPGDPYTFAGMVVLLTAVALLAGYLPARRASKIDPMAALRTQ